MKRFGKFVMIAAMAMVSYSASAELEPQWEKGTAMVNAAIGVQPFGATVSLDYVLVDEWWKGHFTVGGEFDFSVPYKDGIAIGLTPRATYGLNITPEFEVHVTAETGLGFRTWETWDPVNNAVEKTSGSFILFGGFAGCRYFFTENLAVLAEIGGENYFPALRAGITYKF